MQQAATIETDRLPQSTLKLKISAAAVSVNTGGEKVSAANIRHSTLVLSVTLALGMREKKEILDCTQTLTYTLQ
jgi:hypothetical protein